MPSTSAAQEAAHRANIIAAENTKQAEFGAARQAFDNSPGAWPAYDLAIKNATAKHLRAVIASATANGLDGPRATLHDLIGVWQ